MRDAKKYVQCTCSLTVNKNETLCHCDQNVKRKREREEVYSYQVIAFLVKTKLPTKQKFSSSDFSGS